MKIGVTLEQAVDLLTDEVSPLPLEQVPLNAAWGRTLACDLLAPFDQPPFDRSPLDGYAVRAADIAGASPAQPVRLTVVDTVYAGQEVTVPIGKGQALRLTTGAMLLTGCDCVVRQEDTSREHEQILVCKAVQSCENYCNQGEDYRKGAVLICAGTRLEAAALGVLASAGIANSLTVYRRPSVALLCTGDEVVEPHIHPYRNKPNQKAA